MNQVDQAGGRQINWTRLLYGIWAILGLFLVLMLCFIASNAFRPAPQLPVEVADADVFAPNSVDLRFVNARFFDGPMNREVETLPLEVVRDASGNFYVFYARSTNTTEGTRIPRQCVVEWDQSLGRFIELCGGSQWTRDGRYYSGPAPRSLDRFPARVENGKLYIDLKLEQGAPRS